MKKILTTILIALITIAASAQKQVQADQLFTQGNYLEAKELYAQLLQHNEKNQLFLYRYARCAYELNQPQEAIAYFLKAGTRYALRNFYLAELYLQEYQFAQAKQTYQAYLADIDTTNERYRYVLQQIEAAERGERYIKRVTDITIVDSVLLPKADFLQAYQMAPEAGRLMYENHHVTYTNQRNDRRIYVDSLLQKVGLFTCQKLLDGWTDCDTIQLETQGNINFPFMMADGFTLYFASDDSAGLGKYDIYHTRYNPELNTYLTPENLGFPFNSPANDYMLAIDEVHHIGYFATDRFTGDSLVAVYTFIPNEETRILKNVDSTYLALAAQLKVYRKGEKDIAEKPIVPALTVPSDAHFRFVINDAIVCQTISDFQSEKAQQLMNQYLQVEQTIEQTTQALQQARKRYATASGQQQQELAKTILDAEALLPILTQEYTQLEKQIRQYEYNQRGL